MAEGAGYRALGERLYAALTPRFMFTGKWTPGGRTAEKYDAAAHDFLSGLRPAVAAALARQAVATHPEAYGLDADASPDAALRIALARAPDFDQDARALVELIREEACRRGV